MCSFTTAVIHYFGFISSFTSQMSQSTEGEGDAGPLDKKRKNNAVNKRKVMES